MEENRLRESMYESLLSQYKMKPEEELLQITVANGYTEDAERAAKDILSGDRTEYKEHMQKIADNERKSKEMYQARYDNPLYGDIHQIAGDLRFVKNLIIVLLILSVLAGIYLGIQVL